MRPTNIIKTLQTTRAEHPIDGGDVEEWVDRLTSLASDLEGIRDGSDPALLTEKEAEVVVRWYGMNQGADEIADVMGVSNKRVYHLRYAAEDDLLAADATLSIINDLREDIRPNPYEDTPDEPTDE